MAFHIRPSKSFRNEFVAVTRSQLKKAIAILETRAEGTHEAIHAARKRFKRVRALYRLVEPDAKTFRRTENTRIREMAQSLSAVRDATALVETLDFLKSVAMGKDEHEALEQTQMALLARRDAIASGMDVELEDRLLRAIATCSEAMEALEALDLPDGRGRTAKRLEKVWRKQLEKARFALEDARTQHSETAFHELRKCGQTYWMYLQLFEDLWPSAMRAKREKVKHLVDLLGHEHDLSVLMQTINETPDLLASSATLALLLEAVIRSQQDLRSTALDLADGLLLEKASLEAGVIATLWTEAAD